VKDVLMNISNQSNGGRKMKAQELRIGNLLQGLSNIRKIAEINTTSFTDTQGLSTLLRDSMPILLTEEWLLKFGFEKLNRDVVAYEQCNLIVEWLFERWTGRLYFDAYTSIQIIEIKYVHQLQNLYFVLTGEELTIKS
jgi:hypothetical protein